jgi:hypothetical protein
MVRQPTIFYDNNVLWLLEPFEILFTMRPILV